MGEKEFLSYETGKWVPIRLTVEPLDILLVFYACIQVFTLKVVDRDKKNTKRYTRYPVVHIRVKTLIVTSVWSIRYPKIFKYFLQSRKRNCFQLLAISQYLPSASNLYKN